MLKTVGSDQKAYAKRILGGGGKTKSGFELLPGRRRKKGGVRSEQSRGSTEEFFFMQQNLTFLRSSKPAGAGRKN